MNTSWEKPYVLSEVHQDAQNWSLASDARLLLLMEDLSKEIFGSIQDAGAKIASLASNSEMVNAKLANVCNNFSALSSSQFIENRVDENNAKSNIPPPAQPENKAKDEAAVMERCSDALRTGLATLDSQFQRVDIAPLDGNAGSGELVKSSIFMPINPYASRPLPAIIGSLAFFADDYCGLQVYNDSSNASVPQMATQSPPVSSTSPPPPPPLPVSSSNNIPPPPPLPGSSTIRNKNIDDESSDEDEDNEFVDDTKPSGSNTEESRPKPPVISNLHSELFHRINKPAQSTLLDDDDDGDLFSAKPARPVQHKPSSTVIFKPAPADDPVDEWTTGSIPQPVQPAQKLVAPITLPVAASNSLFDAEDDDEGDLFSSHSVSKAAPTVLPSSNLPAGAKSIASNAPKSLFKDDEEGAAGEESDTVKDFDITSVKTQSLTASMRMNETTDDNPEEVKPSRSESVASSKKLPTGAISLFGNSAKANPLAEALKSRLGAVADRINASSPTLDANADSQPPVQPTQVSSPVAKPSPEKKSPEPPKPVKAPVPIAKPTLTLFDDDDDADLFSPKTKSTAPIAAPAASAAKIPSSTLTKPAGPSLLFGVDDSDDDADLFSSRKSEVSIASNASKPTVAPSVAGPVESKAAEPSTMQTQSKPIAKPVSAVSLFDNDDDDEDLFAVSSTKSKPQEQAPPTISAPEKPASNMATPLLPAKTPSSNMAIFGDDDDDDNDFLSTSSVKASAKIPENKETTSKVEAKKPEEKQESLFTGPSKPDNAGLFGADSDDDTALFGSTKPTTSVGKPAANSISKTPVKIPEAEKSKPVAEATNDPLISSPPAASTPTINERIKIAINPLALLPGAKFSVPKPSSPQTETVSEPVSEKNDFGPAKPHFLSKPAPRRSATDAKNDEGSMLNFDDTPSEGKLVASSSRVSGPRRQRPSRWNQEAAKATVAKETIAPSVDSESITDPLSAAATVSSPIRSATVDSNLPPKSSDNAASEKPIPQPAAAKVSTMLFENSSDDEFNIFGAKPSHVSSSIARGPDHSATMSKPAAATTKPTVADVDDIFAD